MRVMMLMAEQGWQLWGVADIYPSICHGHLWKILFGMYGFFPLAYQNRNALVIAAIFSADLTIIYFLYPVVPLFGPLCGTLAGLLCSYAPHLTISCWNMLWSSCSPPMIERQESSDTSELVWMCQCCTSENGVFLLDCDSCGTPRGDFAYENVVIDHSQSSLISRMPNEEVDITGLVWNCMSCRFENGAFVHVCEICGTPRLISD